MIFMAGNDSHVWRCDVFCPGEPGRCWQDLQDPTRAAVSGRQQQAVLESENGE